MTFSDDFLRELTEFIENKKNSKTRSVISGILLKKLEKKKDEFCEKDEIWLDLHVKMRWP